MKKFRLFKLILLTLFVFKILLTSSFANYDLETESKLWEALDKNLKEKKQEKQRQKEQEEQRLKQAQEEQRQKERDKEKALLSKLFPENELSIIAKIDSQIVTSYDLKVESKYLEALNPNLKNLSQEQITKIAKESIIREKIKTNEILKYYELEKDTTHLNEVLAATYNKIGLKNEN